MRTQLHSLCPPQFATAARRTLPLAVGIAMLAGCASQPLMERSAPELPLRDRTAYEGAIAKATDTAPTERFFETPSAPTQAATPIQGNAPKQLPKEPGKEITVAFNGLPLPQFIDSVFGVILKQTISIDPQVQQRRDMVSMRAGKPQTPDELYHAAKQVLRAYGIAIQELPGLVRFVPENSDSTTLPEIRRGRALPEVPESVRPVFYYVELESTQAGQTVNWLKSTFKDRVTFQEDTARNAIMISGPAQNVSAAMQALRVLDQPMMRGKISARITPIYWSADELTRKLNELMTAQGYFSAAAANINAPILFIPVAPINAIIVFATSRENLEYALKWAQELDQPTQVRNGNYFIYPVKNADAADIAATLSQIVDGVGTASAVTAGAQGASTVRTSNRVVVNKATNSIIIQASASDYQQWYGLLNELDRPAKSALITVSVAEVRLQDREQLGFEWLVNQVKLGNWQGSVRTLGSFGTNDIGGLAISLSNPGVGQAILNTLASNSKARILSNPSILTKSGEDATITVGEEVPTLTSTGSTPTTGSGSVIQTIQYRKTGVILRVRPVVRAGGRIDLDLTQEVSSPIDYKAGQVASPSISTRSLTTKLTVTDGNTVVLGGLMRDNKDDVNTGIPYAKDIPILGSLFRSTSNKIDRTELIMMITAYAIEDDYDVQSIADAFRRRFPWTDTLLPTAPVPRPPAAKSDAIITGANSSTLRPAATPYRFGQASTTTQSQEAAPASADKAAETHSLNVTAPPPQERIAGQPSAAPATKPSPTPKAETPGRVVTDPALQRELMEALQKSSKP